MDQIVSNRELPRSLDVVVSLLVALLSGGGSHATAGAQEAATPSPAVASFDCRKASTSIEKTICADPELGALDRRLSSVYARAIRNLDAKDIGQAAWLKKEREGCGSNDAKRCLSYEYQKRIEVLESFANDIVYRSTERPVLVIALTPLGGHRYRVSARQLDEGLYCVPAEDDFHAPVELSGMSLSVSDVQHSTLKVRFRSGYGSLTATTEGPRFCYGSIYRQVEPVYLDGEYRRISRAPIE